MQAPLQARNDSDAAQTDTTRTVAQKRGLADNRPEAVAQRKLAEMMNNSPRVLQQRALSDAIHNSARMVAQRHEMNALFGGAVKRQGDGAIPAEAPPAQRDEKTNNTGLPHQLKSGIESLSGMSMNHVRVHYNSDKPAQLQAHAYAQGSEIHLGAGQERHLPHEAWHVVQQAQGRVRPTLQMKAGAVNDDPSLEKEADMMGEKAAQFEGDHGARNLVAEEHVAGAVTQRVAGFVQLRSVSALTRANTPAVGVIQRMAFERFSGLFSNWGWYNKDEKDLLAKEKHTEELLTSVREDTEYGQQATTLLQGLNVISKTTYGKDQYSDLKASLKGIFDQADRISSKIAMREFTHEELLNDFNSKPGAALAVGDLVERTLHISERPRLRDLGTLRNYLDMLSQFVSDAAMKSKTGAAMEDVKAPILKAAVEIQKAYFLATVQKDFRKAETYMIYGTAVLISINRRQLDELVLEGSEKGAQPKQREAGYQIDIGAMMVAHSFAGSEISPDLVVGLPTGGAHAASRFAASTGILTGNTPELWLTRPQGVKASSKEFMMGTTETDILKREELEVLLTMLRPRWEKAKKAGRTELHVFVIDDGQSSGKTLQMERELYEKALAKAGIPAKVFTGIALGGNRDEEDELRSEYAKPSLNHADYVMNNSQDRAGPRPALKTTDVSGEGAMTMETGRRALEVQVAVVFGSNKQAKKMRVTDLLNPAAEAQL